MQEDVSAGHSRVLVLLNRLQGDRPGCLWVLCAGHLLRGGSIHDPHSPGSAGHRPLQAEIAPPVPPRLRTRWPARGRQRCAAHGERRASDGRPASLTGSSTAGGVQGPRCGQDVLRVEQDTERVDENGLQQRLPPTVQIGLGWLVIHTAVHILNATFRANDCLVVGAQCFHQACWLCPCCGSSARCWYGTRSSSLICAHLCSSRLASNAICRCIRPPVTKKYGYGLQMRPEHANLARQWPAVLCEQHAA
jgi:hypothetical protein